MATGRVPATGQIVNDRGTLGTIHPNEIKYTRRAEPSGWLTVKLSGSGKLVSLCEYTRVAIIRRNNERTYFKIMDGYVSTGEEASLSRLNAELYLNEMGPAGAALINVEYLGVPTEEASEFKGKLKQQWGSLIFNNENARVTLNSDWNGKFSAIPPGIHTILAPDYSHKNISTQGYAQATPNMIGNDVWFPIGLNGSMSNSSRYIHVGHISDGCVTVYELKKWAALYSYLISHRAPGAAGKIIGKLIVKDSR